MWTLCIVSHAVAVTKGEAGRHEFTMRIPAELDRDADYQGFISDLKAKWPEYEKNLNIR